MVHADLRYLALFQGLLNEGVLLKIGKSKVHLAVFLNFLNISVLLYVHIFSSITCFLFPIEMFCYKGANSNFQGGK